jgi:hypothetical protein
LGAIYEQCLFCGPSHLKLPSIGASVDLYNTHAVSLSFFSTAGR